ncbi:MAG: DUF2520 domain-containing protein [Desulfobacterales bacterium]|nr:DUF2520 domain-containing protein [Desulfobacterales bacterium]MBF0396542.1 DUF2520 domain-containing protein [Desulfobacterales bacterium]
MKPLFAIIGCGKVGTALGKFLKNCGYIPFGVASKSLSSAKKTGEIIGTSFYTDNPLEITIKSDIVFITTPDIIISKLCDEISNNKGFREGTFVFHCSGSISSLALSSAKSCGAIIGSIHPLQSFASKENLTNPFEDIIIAIEGEKEAVERAKIISMDLGARAINIETSAKTLYHAAAVISSNYLVTIIDAAFQLLEASGISKDDAFNVLCPLIKGTLSNIEKIGTINALTGPISRGDINTVERHLSEINSKLPQLTSLYKTLGLYTVEIAKKNIGSSKDRLKHLFQ